MPTGMHDAIMFAPGDTACEHLNRFVEQESGMQVSRMFGRCWVAGSGTLNKGTPYVQTVSVETMLLRLSQQTDAERCNPISVSCAQVGSAYDHTRSVVSPNYLMVNNS